MRVRGTINAAALALSAVALAACTKKDDTAADATAATNTMAGTDTAAVSSTPAAPSGWSDANIFALLDEANVSDSSEGAIAAVKGTGAQVREFGNLMMRDHHAMRMEGEALSKKLAIVAQAAADDKSQADMQKNLEMLNTTAKGKDFDKAYIDHQVDDHKAVLEKATRAMTATQNAELKNLLQKTSPKVLGHLDKAEAIQKSMK